MTQLDPSCGHRVGSSDQWVDVDPLNRLKPGTRCAASGEDRIDIGVGRTAMQFERFLVGEADLCRSRPGLAVRGSVPGTDFVAACMGAVRLVGDSLHGRVGDQVAKEIEFGGAGLPVSVGDGPD